VAADRIDELPGVIAGSLLVERNPGRRSTLDLLGPGLTLLTGPDAHAWTTATASLDTPFPLTVHPLDPSTATALQMKDDGAVLVRPDAQVVTHWPTAPAGPAGPAEAAL
jgi:putative polyketide hydroxylase